VSKKPETIIEDDYMQWVRHTDGIVALKLILFSQMGWPDRTIFTNGHTFFIEFKTLTGRLSPQQKHWRTILERLGFTYYVCISSDEAIRKTRGEMDTS
jgi:hypothetical protein